MSRRVVLVLLGVVGIAVPVSAQLFGVVFDPTNYANALLRFYVLHCVILPLAAILFIAVHFWRIRKDGGIYAGDHSSEGSNQ